MALSSRTQRARHQFSLQFLKRVPSFDAPLHFRSPAGRLAGPIAY
jgi:hypothetical protein